jgi:macrolide transport system ATP-binding/permease protein
VVGENGSGKSTLLRIAAGRLHSPAGRVATPPDIGYLAQDSGLHPGSTVGRVLDDALRPLHDVVRRLEALSAHLVDPRAAAAYDSALEWARTHDAWDADRRVRVAAARLGIERLESWRPVSELSGGSAPVSRSRPC